MLRVTWKVILLSLLFIGISGVSVSAAFWDMEEHPMIHDPSMVKENDTYWVFGTGPADGNGIRVIYSNDSGYSWGEAPVIFPEPASWWSDYVPNHASNQWAPDIEYFNGRYWLYYSVSSFGSNQSLIGLLSTDSISSGNWRDDGLVTRTTTSDNYNAIDPAMIVDENGQPWLSYGSYWSGIKLTKLDPNTMKPTGTQHSIAARPSDPEHAVEAPTITYHNGYYYLFVSFDSCCSGVNSDYKIAVGRSAQITGPYYDKVGNSMMQGGGTILDTGNDRWIGPGHQDVYQNLIIRHAYDAESNGLPRLLINDLSWDSNGWPTY